MANERSWRHGPAVMQLRNCALSFALGRSSDSKASFSKFNNSAIYSVRFRDNQNSPILACKRDRLIAYLQGEKHLSRPFSFPAQRTMFSLSFPCCRLLQRRCTQREMKRREIGNAVWELLKIVGDLVRSRRSLRNVGCFHFNHQSLTIYSLGKYTQMKRVEIRLWRFNGFQKIGALRQSVTRNELQNHNSQKLCFAARGKPNGQYKDL